jgi:hypothetical protein
MRRVFTSARLENVEGVANLLRSHEIEVKITNGRTYRGAIRGNFSYREKPEGGEQPAVWVVRSDDQPKARELLREAGLLDSGRSPTTYLAMPAAHELRGESVDHAAKRRAFRIRAALFVALAAALGMSMLAWRKPTTATTAAAPAAAGEPKTQAPAKPSVPTYVVDTPKALAAFLVNAELAAQPAAQLCLTVDGKTPTPAQIETLALPASVRLTAAADCREPAAKDWLGIAISEYRTDGSGQGTIRVEIVDLDKDGAPRVETRTLQVRREDTQCRVRGIVAEAEPSS